MNIKIEKHRQIYLAFVAKCSRLHDRKYPAHARAHRLWESLLLVAISGQHNATRSVLDNIPGPPSEFFWEGNMQQFFNVNGLEFHLKIAQEHGPVVKLHGALGHRLLYVYDPRALHTILLGKHTLYEEGSPYVKYASFKLKRPFRSLGQLLDLNLGNWPSRPHYVHSCPPSTVS